MLNRLLGGGGDWEGSLTAKKWAQMTCVSHDTALRDIHGLIDAGVLRKAGGSTKNVAYALVEPD